MLTPSLVLMTPYKYYTVGSGADPGCLLQRSLVWFALYLYCLASR
ncbi:hypothetical protein ACMV8I_00185 [Ewingella sp. S1.OA.A_B6]